MRKVTLREWQAEGIARFGPDPLLWRFKCPSCGKIQTAKDFAEVGCEPRLIHVTLGFSCIGRWRSRLPDNNVVPALGLEMDAGDGCTYAGGGLFCVAPTLVIISETDCAPVFGWDGEEQVKEVEAPL